MDISWSTVIIACALSSLISLLVASIFLIRFYKYIRNDIKDYKIIVRRALDDYKNEYISLIDVIETMVYDEYCDLVKQISDLTDYVEDAINHRSEDQINEMIDDLIREIDGLITDEDRVDFKNIATADPMPEITLDLLYKAYANGQNDGLKLAIELIELERTKKEEKNDQN